jgi:hypothetical protein
MKRCLGLAAVASGLFLIACAGGPPPPAAEQAESDPCKDKPLPACPTACAQATSELAGKPCSGESRCGNDIGDGCQCVSDVWQCSVHAPLGPGCNRVCR